MSDNVVRIPVAAALKRPLLFAHPIVDQFPDINADAYSRLRDDIKVNGQRKAIGLYQGYIWDGRARYDVCRELGLVPRLWILRVRCPIIYLLQRHKDRFGLPRTSERDEALLKLHRIDDKEVMAGQSSRRREWLKEARDEFRKLIKYAKPCAACGLDREYSHAHHSLPLNIQYDLGIESALQEHDWLCAVHHKMVHRLFSEQLKPTYRNFECAISMQYWREPRRTHGLAAVEIFQKGFQLFKDLGGVAQRGNWDLVCP